MSLHLYLVPPFRTTDGGPDTQIYHEVQVAIFSAEIVHELLEAALLSTHLKNMKRDFRPRAS